MRSFGLLIRKKYAGVQRFPELLTLMTVLNILNRHAAAESEVQMFPKGCALKWIII